MYSGLFQFLPAERIKIDEPMKNHTTFQIGGPVDVMVIPESITDIQKVISFCRDKNILVFVLGMGSNLLVRDKGIRGLVIKLGNGLKQTAISGDEIMAEAGVRLGDLSEMAAAEGLSGLEFAEGIPGSLGGAVVMNAGAYDGEMRDILQEVTAIDGAGTVKKFSPLEMDFGYRRTIFQENGFLVVSALMKLKKDRIENIREKMNDFSRRRKEKQPLEYPSAGSTFKRPEGFYVGPMLEEMGLKGFKVGGAEVSSKHAGFIINSGNATARDVLDLINIIKLKAKERFGVELQTEVKVVGEE